MFKKIKQLKEIKDSLSQEKVRVEKNGIVVVVRGDMEIEEVRLNPDIDIKKQEELLKECLSEAMKKAQMIAMQKISQSGISP